MKTLKTILLIIAVIIAIPLLIAAFSRKDYAIEREVTINKPKDQVFGYIKYLKNQDKFSKWANIDPNMKKEYRGTDGTVGFVSSWDSQVSDVGAGEQEIKSITEGEKIDFELRFKRPFEGVSAADMQTQAVAADQTKVKWGFKSTMPYPMNIILLFVDMEGLLGKDMQEGLDKLKQQMETLQHTPQASK